MKTVLTAVLLFLCFSQIQPQGFDDYFMDKTLRIDYHHTGDYTTELITLDRLYSYGIWAGSLNNLIDNFNNGAYYYKIYDKASGRLIYSKGFDSYFKEYQTSSAGMEGIKKSYHESAVLPMPKYPVIFSVEKRNKQNELNEIFSAEVDPADLYIVKDPVKDKNVTVVNALNNGSEHTKLDIVILGDGYTEAEKEKFVSDVNRYKDILSGYEPYKSHINDINLYGVFKPSEESGSDEPGAGIYRNTVLNTTFYSLGSERYLLTEDNKTMRDLASFVPYDAVFIMVNSPRYGGGGIYNFYCTFTSDNQFGAYLFLHEFGHSFAGLADEYYTSDVAYNEFYTEGLEPVEPNITRLLNPDKLKWKEAATPGVELPTPWEKADYDEMDYKWQAERRQMNKNIAELKLNNSPAPVVNAAQEEYNRKDKEHSEAVDKFLSESKFNGMTGAFEGAGYSAKGMYRPMLDCIMFSKGAKPFCKVCESHIVKVIKHYTE